MRDRVLSVLIVGGYGVFGGRIVRLLADEPRLRLIVAGRSRPSAEAFCAGFAARAKLEPARFDRDGDVSAALGAFRPDIVVDASGPFQDYGAGAYRLVEAAIAHGICYLDLADGSAFVAGIGAFDAKAKERGVAVLSGVSSFPVLTAAVCRRLGADLAHVDTITGGIAPSPYAGVGLNVIRAIASYAGKPVGLTREGHPARGYGLTETLRYTIAPPGRLPLRNTLFSLVDVPDLAVLPPRWPGLRAIWMGAGPVPEVLHRALVGLAWMVRLRLLPSLGWLAPVFHRAINTLRWGEHRGGMFVALEGRTAQGTRVTRSWHMLAEGDDGPFIPSMAVEALVRKALDGTLPAPGARSAVGDLELADYEALFARRGITTGTREVGADHRALPLYRRILGSAFDDLPKPIRDMHEVTGPRVASGRATIERGDTWLSRLIGGMFGFPQAGRDVPVTVRFSAADGTETWTRTFGTDVFSSRQSEGSGRSEALLVETFGIFSFAMALVCGAEHMSLVVRRWTCLGVPLPLALAPTGDSFEHVVDGVFYFNVEIRVPLAGLVVAYRGYLTPDRAA